MPAIASPAPEAMASRLVVMMTPADKRAVEARARGAGLSPSEFVRRAARDYVPTDPAEASALDLLADEIEATVTAMRSEMACLDAEMTAHRAEMARLRARA